MTKELDRRFRHVGRIKRSWGTTHKPTIRAMEQMMDGLFARGRLDILRSIQDRTYTPLEVYDAWRVNELERLPTAATLAPLKESMEKWIAKKECSEAHRLSLAQSLRHLISEKHSKPGVGSLPQLLGALREKMRGKHPRSFNLARAAAQAFVKSTLKRSHPIYAAITDIEPLRVKPTRKGRPMTVAEVALVAQKFREKSRKPYQMNAVRHADSAWAMALSGMGPEEYWAGWHNLSDRIHIDGTKRGGRVRDVPLVRRIATPYATKKAFAEALKDLDLPFAVRPYDFRRTYATWMEAARIPRTRRRMYMGHGKKDVTDSYEEHEVAQFLTGDAEKLRGFVGATETGMLGLVKKA